MFYNLVFLANARKQDYKTFNLILSVLQLVFFRSIRCPRHRTEPDNTGYLQIALTITCNIALNNIYC